MSLMYDKWGILPYQEKFTDEEVYFNNKYKLGVGRYKCNNIEDLKNAYRLISEILFRCPKGNKIISEYISYCCSKIRQELIIKGITCKYMLNDKCALKKEYFSDHEKCMFKADCNCCKYYNFK